MHLHLLPIALALTGTALVQDADTTTPPASSSPVGGPIFSSASTNLSVIFTDLLGAPSASVPGIPGASFAGFDRVYGSPNGNWVLTADTDLPTTGDEVLLLNGAVVGLEGDPAPWAPGENWGLIETKLGVNDAGDLVAATNTDGATTADEYAVKRDSSGTWTAFAKEGDPTGLAALPGTTWGTTAESVTIDASGNPGLSSDGVGGTAGGTSDNDLLVLGGSVLLQVGVSAPPGQVGTELIENFDLSDFFVSADGAHYVVQGDLSGATTSDDFLIVDGTVVLQEDSIIPGSGYADAIDGSGIVGCFMDAGGNWYARGNNDTTEQDWVVRNGVVVAETGGSVEGGAEVYDDTQYADCFFMHVGNSVGDYVIGGVTNEPDVERDGVLVLNGTRVLVRQGDPIDLDGNGVFDDNAFFDLFGNDDAHLTDAGELYFVAAMMDDTFTAIGSGFFKIGPGAVGTSYCMSTQNSSGASALISGSGGASVAANSLVLSAEPVPASVFGIFFYGPNQTLAAFGDGFRCVGGSLQRFPAENSGPGGLLTHAVDYAGVTNPANLITPGSTWNFQGWFRDVAAGGTGFNLSDGLQITFLP